MHNQNSPFPRPAGEEDAARQRAPVSYGRPYVLPSAAAVEAETLQVHSCSGEDVSLVMRTTSGEQPIEGSDILVAARRIPNTAGIGLEEAGVEVDGRGYICVNERLETNAPEVWAIEHATKWTASQSV